MKAVYAHTNEAGELCLEDGDQVCEESMMGGGGYGMMSWFGMGDGHWLGGTISFIFSLSFIVISIGLIRYL